MFPALQSLTDKFSRRPMIAAREMRDLLDSDRAAFLESALELIKGRESLPVHQYLLTLLVTQNLIIERLANPAGLDLAEAAQIARCIQAATMFTGALAIGYGSIARMSVTFPKVSNSPGLHMTR